MRRDRLPIFSGNPLSKFFAAKIKFYVYISLYVVMQNINYTTVSDGQVKTSKLTGIKFSKHGP